MYKIGILGASDIAFNRFVPALLETGDFEIVGLGSHSSDSPDRAERFAEHYGIQVFQSYDEVLDISGLDAVYIPLPPAVHHEWAMKALQKGLHVLLEKPFTIELRHTQEIINLARQKNLAVHENYMFVYHSQLRYIKKVINSGSLGELRLIRSFFGFPMRLQNDFRYRSDLGGGALYDAAGYVAKLANYLLDDMEIAQVKSNYISGFNVDMYGSFVAEGKDGLVFQGAYGMDNSYQCNLEIFGSKGHLSTNRIFTAPADYNPMITINIAGENEIIKLDSDSHFRNSIENFSVMIKDKITREDSYEKILKQAEIIEKMKEGKKND